MADLYTYPKLQEILPIDKIPNVLLGIEDLANILTDKLFYKNYYSSVSPSKHSGFHKLTLNIVFFLKLSLITSVLNSIFIIV